MFTRALFLDALSLLCACGALPAPSEGITLVRATPDAILLSGSCGGASLRIVELQPQEAALPANFGAVVATVVARSNFSSRLPRFDGSRDRLFSSFLALQEGPAGQTFNGGRPGETRAPPASPALTPLGTNRFVEAHHSFRTRLSRSRPPRGRTLAGRRLRVRLL